MDKKLDNLENKIDNLFFDLDGTLLQSDKTISKETLIALEKLKKQNKKISIVTGRPYYFAKEEAELLDIDFPIVACNGSIVFDFKQNQVIFANPIDVQTTKMIFDILIKYNITFLIYTTEQMIGFTRENHIPRWFNWLKNTLASKKPRHRFKIDFFSTNKAEKFDIEKHQIIKFLLIKEDCTSEQITLVKNKLQFFKNIYLLQSQSNVIDVMPKNCSKGNALQWLAKNYHFSLENTIVFGDEYNDVSMFQVARYSVAMGQSAIDIKKYSTFETLSNNENGIANFINLNLLKQ
ncbi:HAD family hydrolase [Mycoplasmopsis cricetuli]|uniref:HAD family hydrolase n=1 Tax=Mycoplasmopsis cricetuli TaxID=171283 RepID=UPI0004724CFC|nr:HAD family hydrolase [Mycoplasmopsis cricetuli]